MTEWKKYRIIHEFKAPVGLAEKIMEFQREVIRNTRRDGKLIFYVDSNVTVVDEQS